MSDQSRYQSALAVFLEFIDSVGADKAQISEQLRFPAFDFSTLVGSQEGRRLWEHPSAQSLIDVLLEDPELNRWFSPAVGGPNPEVRLNELRSQIASLVAVWNGHQFSGPQVAEACAARLLACIKNPAPTCSRFRILYGVSIAAPTELPSGTIVEPLSAQRVMEILANSGANEREVLKIPRHPAVIVGATSQATRAELGAFAATTANVGAEIMLENTRWDLWLATGTLPRLGDAIVYEPSEFPVTLHERVPSSQRELFALRGANQEAQVELEILTNIAKRMEVLRGPADEFSPDVISPLWIANTFIHSAVDAGDGFMAVLLAYAGCEGLLIRRDDNDSRFGPRLAALTSDEADARRIRRVAARWMELRGFGAHGQRPPIEAVGAFLERTISPEDLGPYGFGVQTIREAGRDRAAALLRRTFLAMLYCCVDLDAGGRPVPSLDREAVVDLLDRASSLDSEAKQEIDRRVPQLIRDVTL